MTPERWQQIEELFHGALEREPNERAAFLAEACAGDAALRREIESLLAAHEQAGSFYEEAASELATEWLAGKAQPMVGQTIGHFKILDLLGAGGMGEVYRALDTKLDRTVAVKILPEDFASDEGRLRRFVREAKAASALNHPHVATIHEIGDSGSMGVEGGRDLGRFRAAVGGSRAHHRSLGPHAHGHTPLGPELRA